MESITSDIVGQKFGRLTAIGFSHTVMYGKSAWAHWLFVCDCGVSKVINLANVRRGLTKSCGCLSVEIAIARSTTHGSASGGKFTGSYQSWRCMKERFSRPLPRYEGVTVCERWLVFENFLNDMGERPDGMTLDRIDGSKGYSKDNCRWATPSLQAHNQKKRRNTTSSFRGVSKHKKKWQASISRGYEKIHLGSFSTEIAAAAAYNQAATKIYGPDAILNVIEP